MIRPSMKRICRLGSSAGTSFYCGLHRGQRDSLLTIARAMRDHGDKESASIYLALARSANHAYVRAMRESLNAVERDHMRLTRLLLAKATLSELAQ